MAKLIYMTVIVLTLSACTQSPVKNVQLTLDKQLEADQHYANNDCDKALPLYKDLAATMKSDTKSLLRIGNCYARVKDYEQATMAYQQLLLRDPESMKGWYNLSYIRAQILADTVTEMYKHVDQRSPEAEKIRSFTIDVLKPFEIDVNNHQQALE